MDINGGLKFRKDLDTWHFCVEGENASLALARFLIAFEELRVRLAPSKYPNVEISDEGHLWFNIDTSIGTVEVLAFPHGFEEIESPSIAVSIPRKAEDVDLNLLKKIRRISESVMGTQLFAHKTATTKEEILSAFKRNRHPLLSFTSDFDEILQLKNQGAFLSYLGVCFAVAYKTVSEAERIIRNILSRLEEK